MPILALSSTGNISVIFQVQNLQLWFCTTYQLIEIDNKFSQNYTALGLGAKYQLSESLNIETLYSKFIRTLTAV
jgi:hypothetical protein